jgi:hypothetical protein
MNISDTSLHALPASADDRRGWLDSRAAFALLCLAAIGPLLVVEFPPLVDLYGHLGRFAVQTDLANRPELQPYFSYDWKLIGNLGADLLVQALHRVLGLEGAVRFVVILTQLLGAAGLLLVSREVHGRITPFALMAIPLLYGYPFNYGFINYALSMALALLAFVMWLRLHRAGRGVAAQLWLALAGAAIWVCHTYGWAFLGLLCGSTMLAEVITARTPPLVAVRRILAACWPLLLPAVPMVVWRAESTGAGLAGWSLPYKLTWLLSPLRTMWRALDIATLAVIAAVIALAPLFRRTFRHDLSLRIAAGLCIAFFFALPTKVFGSAFADMRLLPYGLALALIAIVPGQLAPWLHRVTIVLALAFFAGRLAITGAAYVAQDRAIQAELSALGNLPVGARVAYFVVKPCRLMWALPVYDHLAGAALARRSAFVNDQWQQPGVNPLIVHYPAAGLFVKDPSHLAQGDDCNHSTRPAISDVLAKVPLDAFTHVWIVGAVPERFTRPARLVRVLYPGKGHLYAVGPAAVPGAPKSR